MYIKPSIQDWPFRQAESTALFGQISEIFAFGINDMNTTALCSLLLHGSLRLNLVANKMILNIINWNACKHRCQPPHPIVAELFHTYTIREG